MNCVGGVGESIKIGLAFYSVDEATPIEIELDGKLAGLDLTHSGRKFPQKVLVTSLDAGDLANALRIATSYCWASAKAFSQEERLKLLWGAFNALYRYQTRQRRDIDGLDDTAKLFLEERFLNRTLCVYSNEIRPLNYRLFVRWKMLTDDRSRALYIRRANSLRIRRPRGRGLLYLTARHSNVCGTMAVATWEAKLLSKQKLTTASSKLKPMRAISIKPSCCCVALSIFLGAMGSIRTSSTLSSILGVATKNAFCRIFSRPLSLILQSGLRRMRPCEWNGAT